MADYLICPNGKIISTKGPLRELKQTLSGCGYLTVRLYHNGKGKTRKVHRLVAETYVPNPDNKPQVNHKDGNKLNNDVDNLEWATGSENMIHATKMGLNASGVKSYLAKLSEQDVRGIRFLLEAGYSPLEVAGLCNTTRGNVYQIKQGRSWRHID